MGDHNWNIPIAVGMEWQPTGESALTFASSDAGFAQRIRPGAKTLTAIHRYHRELVGAAPGQALEVVDNLMPTVSVSSYFPGTDVYVTGWESQAAGTASFAQVADKINVNDYIRNVGTLQTYEQRSLVFRGASAALTGKRIAYISLNAMVRSLSYSNTDDIGLEGLIDLGGVRYYGPARRVRNDGNWNLVGPLAAWRLNPSTNLPWTQAEVNLMIQAAGTDEFGVRVSYPRPNAITTQGFHVSGLWLDVVYATENRFAYYYDPKRTLKWWQRFPVSGAVALAANTEYWLVEYPLLGGTGNFSRGSALTDTTVVEAASGAATVGEHRQLLAVGLQNGIVTSVFPDARTVQDSAVTKGVNGALIGGVLLEDNTAAILGQSNPYVQLDRRKIASDSAANIGQQITLPAGTAYGALHFPVAWNRANVRPDRELTVEVRYGAGAISGGGTLAATATLQPGDIDGTLQRKQVNFAAAFTATAVQHFVLFRSSTNTYRAWDVVRLDTHSDLIDTGAGTTVAQIEGASQGGQTDGYVEAGTAYTRYDMPVSLIAAPTAPAGFTATVKAAVTNFLPPRVELSWTATSFGAAFMRYRGWRRPSRTPAVGWEPLFEFGVGTGQTAATVEAQHTKFTDSSAGWSNGTFAAGYDYRLTVTNANNGLESAGVFATSVVVAPDPDRSWVTSNDAPWLSSPVLVQALAGEDLDQVNTYRALGRDLAITRTRSELPGRKYEVTWVQLPGHLDDLRAARAAAASGRQLCLASTSGDLVYGTLGAPRTRQSNDTLTTDVVATFTETSRRPVVAGFNVPAGLVLNGTSQYVSVADSALLNPAGAFTIIECAVFPNPAAVAVYLSKGAQGGGVGYFLMHDPATDVNNMKAKIKGATTTATLDHNSASWFDGSAHVATLTSTGSVQALYQDDTATPVATGSTTHGAVSIAKALVAGANNEGVDGFAALAPVRTVAYYPRVLAPTEVQAAARYLLGYAIQRMPAGASLFLDLRDQRSWNGLASTVVDLSGNNLNGTAVASPAPRGIPFALSELERF